MRRRSFFAALAVPFVGPLLPARAVVTFNVDLAVLGGDRTGIVTVERMWRNGKVVWTRDAGRAIDRLALET